MDLLQKNLNLNVDRYRYRDTAGDTKEALPWSVSFLITRLCILTVSGLYLTISVVLLVSLSLVFPCCVPVLIYIYIYI